MTPDPGAFEQNGTTGCLDSYQFPRRYHTALAP
jgi:hypothetical protein